MFIKKLLMLLVGLGLSLMVSGCEQANLIIVPINQPPVPVIIANPLSGFAKLQVTFDASLSYDLDGWIVSYEWDFGDGSKGSGQKLSHLYEDDSDFNNDGLNEGYIVTLTVMDNQGARNSTVVKIFVYNPAPIAKFSWRPLLPYTFETVVFDASESYDPARALGIFIEPAKIISYHWNFGDGTTGEGKIVSHSYQDNGRYLVTLTIMDDDYATSSSSQVIEVLNRPPVVDFSWRDCPIIIPLDAKPEGILLVRCIEFDASPSYDMDGWIVSYEWDFGDGSKGYGVRVQHEFVVSSYPSPFTVTLIVTDNDGAKEKKEVKLWF
jgi:PKD repeat protein